MNDYRLIALDLDGTLTNAEKKITPRTLSALLEAQLQGKRVILASGRPPYGIIPLAEELELEKYGGFILSYNGGKLINWQTKETIFQQTLPNELLPIIYNCSKSSGFPVMTYIGKEIFTEAPDNKYVAHASFINKMTIHGVSDFLHEIELPLNKCLIVGEPDSLHQLELKMKEEYGHLMGIFRSQPFFIEVVPLHIDKAKTLDVLLKDLGFTRDNLIAVGDGWNDISMIEYAGLGVAMCNAQDEVKEKADYITTNSNEDDGVAEIVEKFLLS